MSRFVNYEEDIHIALRSAYVDMIELYKCGRFEESAKSGEKALRMSMDLYSPYSDESLRVMDRLIVVYGRLGNKERERELTLRRESIKERIDEIRDRGKEH